MTPGFDQPLRETQPVKRGDFLDKYSIVLHGIKVYQRGFAFPNDSRSL